MLDLGEDRLDAAAVIDAGFEVARLLAVPHRAVSNPAFREEEA